jgi:hypothetical protein
MSTLRADNFANRIGSSSITADTLLQGTAKAWFNLNGTGVIAATDSFNMSSFTDNGIGDYNAAFAVARPNANYAYLGGGFGIVLTTVNAGQAPVVQGVRVQCIVANTAAAYDPVIVPMAFAGDPT